MSLDVDLAEFRNAYLAEADELVTAANDRLLAVEAAVKAGSRDPKSVRELFRALHTLKGLTAMVGIEPIVAITHRMEAILRSADRSGVSPELPTIERLFGGMRAVEQRLRAMSRGEAVSEPPAALLRGLDSTAGTESRERAVASPTLDLDPALAAKLAAFELDQLAHPTGGRRALRVDFAPSTKRAAEGLTIDVVRQRVGGVAEIVKVVPVSAARSEAAPSGLLFALLLLSAAGHAEIAAAAGVQPEDVREIASSPVDEIAPSPELDLQAHDDFERAERRGGLRVDAARIDDALDQLSGLLVNRARLSRAIASLAEVGAPIRDLTAVLQDQTRQLRDLRGAILRLRMVPFAEVLARLPLVMRGLQKSTDKEVRLVVSESNGAELDKTVAERIFPALVHLLRNAVDHGIETKPERLRRGKPPYGTVRVGCELRTHRQLEITITDDGGGIDREAVARRAAQPIPDEHSLLEAICRPGLSTREEATATSGRGMGMDIVRKVVVQDLGGDLELITAPGEGSTFLLRIPLTVAVLDAFTVQCGAERFVIPVTTVDEVLEIDPARIIQGPPAGGRPLSMLVRRGKAVPLIHLGQALGWKQDEATEAAALRALVVRRGMDSVAFRLDRVLAQQETVVRPLLDPLVQVPGVAGSTDLGDGRATLVLDLVSLAGRFDGRRRPAALVQAS